MDVSKNIERMQAFMDLDGRYRTAMMTCTAGRVDEALLGQLTQLESGYQLLLRETTPEDMLVKAEDLRQRIADVTDWRGRALENARRFDEAIIEFDRAAELYDAIGKSADVQRSRDKAGNLRVETTGDIDAEVKRLRARLEDAPPDHVDRIQILITLGELHSRANDDFEAIRLLKKAEAELLELGGHPNDGDLMAALGDTVKRINEGEQVAGLSAIETGMQRRALTQRLLLALGNAYRTTDPKQAALYEDRLRSLDQGKDANMQELLGRFLDAGQDVQKFLGDLPGKD